MKLFFLPLLIFTLNLIAPFLVASVVKKPNLIVIMCDDLGYAAVVFNGCKVIPPPTIDSIAKNGIRFTS